MSEYHCPDCYGTNITMKSTYEDAIVFGINEPENLEVECTIYVGDMSPEGDDPAWCGDCPWQGTFDKLINDEGAEDE